MDDTKNSFTFLRLCLAILVVFSHSFPNGGFGADPVEKLVTARIGGIGTLAVYSFFAISGYLVSRSLFQSRSSAHFLWKRALRVFPAFWAALFISAFILGPFLFWKDHSTLNGYFIFGPPGPFSYFYNNFFLQMNQYVIRGLLPNTPVPGGLNGSCWTLIYEFLCYLAVLLPAILFLNHKNKTGMACAVLFLALWISAAFDAGANRFLFIFGASGHSAMFPVFFFAGALFFFLKEKIAWRRDLAVLAAVFFLISLRSNLFYWIAPAALTYFLLWFAAKAPIYIYGNPKYRNYRSRGPRQDHAY